MTENAKVDSDCKIVSFINMKGGVGKTTLCREIGYGLYKQHNKSVLFIDIDPQANLTQSLFERYSMLPKELYDDLDQEAQSNTTICNQSIHKLLDGGQTLPLKNDVIANLNTQSGKNLDLVPGDLKTVFLERSNTGSIAENSLDKFIAKNNLTDDYDFIFIDCPPTYSFYTTAAFNASNFYIVPVGIDPYSVLGIDLLEQVVSSIKENNFRVYENKTLENMGIIFNPILYTSNPTNSRQLTNQRSTIQNSQKLAKYNLYYFKEYFNYNSKYKEELGYFVSDKNDKTHNSNVSKITTEFIDRLDYLTKEE
ncbi:MULTISPECIES: ParA family protein [Latilactobacillus]|uniref:Chromosome partitioning protein ParA n=1 Tax=Latilactobacillus curvatus TaxID=28038 RepID=A0ABM7QY83_LATCU|nr:ParA family protein [Latilactobacillus curvatus]UTC12408.1 hypothetical protein A4W75_04730 [Latilactobacillus curvatus]BCX31453.1 chromosome partitioning protein ParA [Latilactobacillus curvatus]